ncbi:hypothetical protein PACTADRAFT_33779 [Pachysolen tannophilus NRRL Y-2460]|uniref:Uncharacterized protein n=1 Tax=Pachysolen tannophilus NRRL Y-2460 TaxID=669874 RepID=A0A1E4TTY2_PACTA|nr:hypothetical protein PACTADRAFT_33779 [Pachysolen tannophilus NRRL Y-2460]
MFALLRRNLFGKSIIYKIYHRSKYTLNENGATVNKFQLPTSYEDFIKYVRSNPGAFFPYSVYSNILNNHLINLDKKKLNVLREFIEVFKNDKRLSSVELADLHNLVITRFTNIDYSVATMASLELKKLVKDHENHTNLRLMKPTLRSLIEIIKYNPGRVSSSWEIFSKEIDKDDQILSELANKNKLQNELVTLIIEKLLYGDFCEKEDKFKIDAKNLSRIEYLIHKYNRTQVLSENLQLDLVKACIDLKSIPIIKSMKISSSILGKILLDDTVTLSDDEFISIFSIYFQLEKSFVNYELLFKVLPKLAAASSEASTRKSIQKEKTQIIFNEVQEMIKKLKLDSGTSYDSATLRQIYIHSLGIENNNLKKSLEIFHHYQATQNSNLSQLHLTISLVFCYHSCLKKDIHLIKAAEALLPGDIMSIKNIQAFILTYAFNCQPEKSLEIYNSYIKDISTENNEQYQVSPAALLTESLILGYLYNLDREFAYLVNDGALTNKIVEGPTAINRIKKLFKLYGDAFEEEDPEKAKEIIGLALLKNFKIGEH